MSLFGVVASLGYREQGSLFQRTHLIPATGILVALIFLFIENLGNLVWGEFGCQRLPHPSKFQGYKQENPHTGVPDIGRLWE